ncbi:MAG: GspH/FimT family pseudopilin [Gammaproteobacteria bacterium]|nr:GspH/FimT family pseudopilin [Gammaproteobacteria bacterium]
MLYRTERGVSLAEFVVTLTLLAVCALLTAPVYYKFVDELKATNFTNSLVGVLGYARGQAVERGLAVSICSSDDGHHCTDTPWEHGYIVFVDDAGEPQVLKRYEPENSAIRVTLTGHRYIRFAPAGNLAIQASLDEHAVDTSPWLAKLSPVAAAYADDDVPPTLTKEIVADTRGTFQICAGHAGRVVQLSMIGRISTKSIRCD